MKDYMIPFWIIVFWMAVISVVVLGGCDNSQKTITCEGEKIAVEELHEKFKKLKKELRDSRVISGQIRVEETCWYWEESISLIELKRNQDLLLEYLKLEVVEIPQKEASWEVRKK